MALAPAPAPTSENLDVLLRSSWPPLAVLELASHQLIAVNAAFAGLTQLEIPEHLGVDLCSMVTLEGQPMVGSLLDALAVGAIQFCQVRGKLRRRDGRLLEFVGWVSPLDLLDPAGCALVGVIPDQRGVPRMPEPLATEVTSVTLCTLDHEGRFTDITSDATDLVGWDIEAYRGTPIQAVVHPEDLPLLLLTMGRSSAERRAALTNLRIRRHDGSWARVRCQISPLCTHIPPRLAVAVWPSRADLESETVSERESRLEAHLWRIGVELKAAGITDVGTGGDASWSDPLLRDLSRRQGEILRRLLGGKRVPTIADELFLSQSTVRNHLAAIYRKLGVHSQPQLLSRLQASTDE